MKKISKKTLFEGDWLSFKEITYLSNKGKEIRWESITRKQRCTGVVIIAKLIPSNRYVLIKQYRPTINNYIIGFPAGLSHSDNIVEDALRELKEETGYIGKVTTISPILKVNSSIMDDSCQIVNVEIDEKDTENTNPKQSLEPSEEIEVILKKEKEIKRFLEQEKENGYEISSGLWSVFGIK